MVLCIGALTSFDAKEVVFRMKEQSVDSFIHSGHSYSASSSPPLLRGAPDTARILCRNFTPKHHRQLRVKDLPKFPTWQPLADPTSVSANRNFLPNDLFRHFPKRFMHFPKNI